MKSKFGREIALLTLPILIIGGVAWLQAGRGRALIPAFLTSNPFDPGPMRVEYSPFQVVDVKPFDVADGVEWAVETTVQTRGKWDVPPGWKSPGSSGWFLSRVQVDYRRGKGWKTAPIRRGKRSMVSVNLNASSNLTTLKVDLEGVPRDADEVRLRGRFDSQLYYSGAFPRGWKAPPNLRIIGPNRILTLQSKPFDVQIKGPSEPFPVPDVDREPKIELIEAKWFTEVYSNGSKERFLLHLRHNGPRGWNGHGASVHKVKAFDARGRELDLFYGNGAGKQRFYEYVGSYNQDLFSPKRRENDRIEGIMSDDVAPRGGWRQAKQPIRIEMEISDNQCWPLQTRITLRHEPNFDQKTLGAK